ncbi:MAG: hypothetical protein L0Y66_18050 [Myxococcaceae bacterium]|nr:hypothetical protein [Myxococcaceae bacterium]
MSPAPSKLLLLASLLAPALATASPVTWHARLGVEAGVDTNAARDYVQGAAPAGGTDAPPVGPVAPPVAPRMAPVISVLGAADAQLRGERTWASGAYDVGARKFIGPLETEDTLVQAAQLEAGVSLSPHLQLSAEARAKDRRGGRRAYTDFTSAGLLTLLPDARLSLQLRLGGHRFVYRELPTSSFGAFEAGWTLRYRIDRRHSITAGGELGTRRYEDGVLDHAHVLDPTRRREDGVLGASLGYSYRGPFALGVGYSHFAQQSNSFGDSMTRHRVSLSAGVRLPWEVMALGQVGLHWGLYPDGAFFSSDVLLAEDEESMSSALLKLVRPLSGNLDLELRYGVYAGAVREHSLEYLRQVAGVGFTWRL